MHTAASRNLRKNGFITLGAYFVVFFAVNFLVFRTHPLGKLLWFYAALPTLPLVGVFGLMGRYLRQERDEFRRDLVVRCLLWGLGGVMSVHVFESFLHLFGWSGVFPPFCELFVFAIFMLAAKISYRVANRVPVDA